MQKKILVGVAWPYVNGDIHVGHLAGYLIPADIFARYHRLRGNDVLMVSGSDCHGTPITVEADKQKVSPAEIVARYHQNDMALFKQYGLSYNLYTKTTTGTHKRVVHELFLDLLKNDYIVVDTMKQYYSAKDKQFLPDRYVEGTCPYCGTKDQRSDQCENCGRWIGDGELIEPYSKLTGAEVELRDTEHYFLDFPKLSAKLEDYLSGKLDGRPKSEIWKSWIYKESAGWLKEGLQKRAITRDMDWSIELPVAEIKKLPPEKQLKNFEGKRIYVWFEAVIGYLSAAVEWSETKTETNEIIFRKDPGQGNDWTEWWQNPGAEIYNFMGQDNLVFHTLMWPGELIGAGKKYGLPYNVIVNKFMNYEGKKFSKSRGWTIDSKKIADKYGVDPMRYYISANLPENKEADFTWDGFVDAVNNELVANLGNFVNRTLVFFERSYGGIMNIANHAQKSNKLKTSALTEWFDVIGKLISEAKFVEAFNKIFEFTTISGNKFFNDEKIWELVKTDKAKADIVMFNSLIVVEAISIMIAPFLPESSEKIRQMLGLGEFGPLVGQDKWRLDTEVLTKYKLESKVEILFAKLEREKVLKEKEN